MGNLNFFLEDKNIYTWKRCRNRRHNFFYRNVETCGCKLWADALSLRVIGVLEAQVQGWSCIPNVAPTWLKYKHLSNGNLEPPWNIKASDTIPPDHLRFIQEDKHRNITDNSSQHLVHSLTKLITVHVTTYSNKIKNKSKTRTMIYKFLCYSCGYIMFTETRFITLTVLSTKYVKTWEINFRYSVSIDIKLKTTRPILLTELKIITTRHMIYYLFHINKIKTPIHKFT